MTNEQVKEMASQISGIADDAARHWKNRAAELERELIEARRQRDLAETKRADTELMYEAALASVTAERDHLGITAAGFAEDADLLQAKATAASDQVAYELGYENPSLSSRIVQWPHLVLVNAFHSGQMDRQNQQPKNSAYDRSQYDPATFERNP